MIAPVHHRPLRISLLRLNCQKSTFDYKKKKIISKENKLWTYAIKTEMNSKGNQAFFVERMRDCNYNKLSFQEQLSFSSLFLEMSTTPRFFPRDKPSTQAWRQRIFSRYRCKAKFWWFWKIALTLYQVHFTRTWVRLWLTLTMLEFEDPIH